jgi:hypothetical protein
MPLYKKIKQTVPGISFVFNGYEMAVLNSILQRKTTAEDNAPAGLLTVF